jgi:hypothetical protein
MGGTHVLKNHLVAFLGELVGTFLFLFIAFAGTQTAFAGQTKLSTDPVLEPSQLLDIPLKSSPRPKARISAENTTTFKDP